MDDRQPLDTGQSSSWGFDDYMQQAPRATSGEATTAAFDLAQKDTATILGARFSANKDLESLGAKKLTAEEANAQFPGMPVPYKDSVSPYVAQLNWDQHQDREKLQQKIASGPDDWWSQTKQFGAGLVAHAMDPLEFGAGMLTGMGVGAAAGRTAVGASLAEAAPTNILARAALHGGEAVAGNTVQMTAQEVATAQGANREHEEYNTAEGVKNAATSILFGSLLHLGIKEGSFQAASRVRNLLNLAPNADLPAARTVLAQDARGANADIGPIVEAVAKETDVTSTTHPDKVSYNYEPVDGKTIGDKSFYFPSKGPELSQESSMQIGEQRAIGAQGSDNPGVANAAAVRSFSDGQGTLHEVSGRDMNPLVLSEAVPSELHEAFSKALDGLIEDPAKTEMANHTAKELLDEVWKGVDSGKIGTDRVLELQEEMKKAGYNAIVDDGREVLGEEHSPHNLVTVLDPELLNSENKFKADPSVRIDPTPEKLEQVAQAAQDPAASLNPESLKASNDLLDQVQKEGVKFEPTDDKEFTDHFQSLADQGEIDPGMAKEALELVKNEDARAELENRLLRAVIGCSGG